MSGKAKSAGIVPIDKNRPAQIGQEELLEERILHQKAMRAIRRWKACQKSISDRMLAGTSVEPGPFVAELEVTVR